jgi:hypothetical protein
LREIKIRNEFAVDLKDAPLLEEARQGDSSLLTLNPTAAMRLSTKAKKSAASLSQWTRNRNE